MSVDCSGARPGDPESGTPSSSQPFAITPSLILPTAARCQPQLTHKETEEQRL